MALYIVRPVRTGDEAARAAHPSSRREPHPSGPVVAITRLLRGVHPRAVMAAPGVECIEAVELVAVTAGLEVQPEDRLGAGAAEWFLLGLMTGARHGLVVCPDPDVLDRALSWVRRHGELADNRSDDAWDRPGTVWKASPRSHGSCRVERYTIANARAGECFGRPRLRALA